MSKLRYNAPVELDGPVTMSNKMTGYRQVVLTKTANYTCTKADSGKVVIVNPAATTLVQLPSAAAVGAGWNVTIIVTEDDGGVMDQRINIGTASGEFFNGIIIGGNGEGSVIANGTSNDFIQVLAQGMMGAASYSGERFDIVSDGTRMHAVGLASATSVTKFADAALSAP